MIYEIGDIDIDCPDRNNILNIINYVPASIIREKNHVMTIEGHNTGVFVQNAPVDPVTGYCSVDYRHAEKLGYFKLDLLNLNVYKDIKDENHLTDLLDKEPLWELLEHRDIVKNLYQIHEHFNIVERMKPRSIEQLAMVLAIIRPGKQHLIDKSWEEIEAEIWTRDDADNYAFKRSHAIAYSFVIIMQLNLLVEEN